ncbi:hypothetical protein Hypma_008106 [Hypsizygus marmoreus]|uniref:Uncharacterized protein n=1 Tax=Hypsizygus marmoreus TaxID=39966 RepID=A0A369JTT8_HYPMA|nr:hypothetical protein Hypma_008106 [Hypsizygus marmoreus]
MLTMSLARAALLARQRPAATLLSHRKASSSAHEHHEEHDNEQYPKEGFYGPFWRNTVLGSLLVAAAYKYAPEPSSDVYLTRWIALYTAPRDLWLEIAARHTALSIDDSERSLLLSDARRPQVHRYRYTQSFEQQSPFLTPVGMEVDTSSIVVKGDNE